MSDIKDGASGRILVLSKVTAILNCFSVRRPELTMAEIRRASGLPGSTCQRLVQSLTEEGFIDRDGDDYRIGLGLLRWAVPATEGLDIVRASRSALRQLRDDTGESAVLYVRDRDYRTVVAVENSHHAVVRTVALGMVAPLSGLGSAARIFLAYDDDAIAIVSATSPEALQVVDVDAIRTLGYAATFSEREIGSASVSAPVWNGWGNLAAVIGVAGPHNRMEDTAAQGCNAAAVLHAAGTASQALGADAAD